MVKKASKKKALPPLKSQLMEVAKIAKKTITELTNKNFDFYESDIREFVLNRAKAGADGIHAEEVCVFFSVKAEMQSVDEKAFVNKIEKSLGIKMDREAMLSWGSRRGE